MEKQKVKIPKIRKLTGLTYQQSLTVIHLQRLKNSEIRPFRPSDLSGERLYQLMSNGEFVEYVKYQVVEALHKKKWLARVEVDGIVVYKMYDPELSSQKDLTAPQQLCLLDNAAAIGGVPNTLNLTEHTGSA